MARRRTRINKTENFSNAIVLITEVNARSLITIGPDSKWWSGKCDLDSRSLAGAIVRLVPPADATDSQVEQVKGLMESEGVVAVKVLPRAQIGKVADADSSDDIVLSNVVVGIRDAVMLVAERMASSDKTALVAELNSAMDEAGL